MLRRALVALWLIVLGIILCACACGYRRGALLLVAAGLVGWLAYQTGLQRLFRERPGSAGAIEICFPHTVRVCPAQEILARLHALASTRQASRI
jgi:hypothetical protein